MDIRLSGWSRVIGAVSDVLQVQACAALPKALPLPLYGSRIAAGFPSPADDHLEATLDLNEHQAYCRIVEQ